MAATDKDTTPQANTLAPGALSKLQAAWQRIDPRVRDIILVVAFCAIGTISRIAFAGTAHVKPTAALIMVFALYMGRWRGAAIGAAVMLFSNFYFGQGIYTLFQMLAYGLCGFVFGALKDFGIASLSKLTVGKVLVLSTMGAFLIFFIAGPITDLSATALYMGLSVGGIIPALAAGAPINAVHAVATFVTLLVILPCLLLKSRH